MENPVETPSHSETQVPKHFVEEDLSTVSTSTRLAAAAGLTRAAVAVATSSAQTAQLVPGEGDALSWRNYIGGFQGGWCCCWLVGWLVVCFFRCWDGGDVLDM